MLADTCLIDVVQSRTAATVTVGLLNCSMPLQFVYSGSYDRYSGSILGNYIPDVKRKGNSEYNPLHRALSDLEFVE